MAGTNIKDVSSFAATPVNPYQSQKSQNDDKGKEDFMALMAGSVSNAANIQVNVNTKVDTSELTQSVNNQVSPETGSYSPVKDNIKDTKSKEIDIPKVVEEIENYEEKVKDAITEELDITDEELEYAMESLGLTFVDLTEPSNLSMLLNEINGEGNEVSLLLDTSVRELFDTMGELTGELFENTGLDTQGLISIVDMEPVTDKAFEMTEDIEPIAADIAIDTVDITNEASVNTTPVEIENTVETQPKSTENVEPVLGQSAMPAEEEYSDVSVSDEDSATVDALAGKVVRVDTNESAKNETSSQNNNNNSNTQAQSQMATTTAPVNEVQIAPTDTGVSFNQAIADVDAAPEVPTYTNVNTADVIEQIVTQAHTTITTEVRSMELELNPHNLGRMLMQVSESEGQVTARFLTQNESVRAALESAITSLVEKLNEQGVKVDAVEVAVGTHEFEENLEQNFAGDAREDLTQSANEQNDNNDNRSRGGIHLGDPDYMEGAELSEEEQLQASIMRTYGNTVNFTA